MRDAILIQQASGEHVALLRLTMERHVRYAERHGMDYVAYFGEVQPEGWHPVWSRSVLCLDELARGRKFVFSVDADAAIVDEATDLRQALPVGDERGVIGLVQHPGPPVHLNCGVMLMRNGSLVRRLLVWVIRNGPGGPPWYEQAILNEIVVKRPEFEGVVVRVNEQWNSTYQVNESSDPVIKAWHGGWPVAQKLAWMGEAVRNAEYVMRSA